jgi:hypothetical protein
MAIRNFFGFDDVPLPAGEQVAATVTLGQLPFSFKPGQAVAKGGVTYSKANGWLKCTGSVDSSSSSISKNNHFIATLASLGLTQGASAVITIGVRWFFPIPVTVAANWPHPMGIVTSGSVTLTTLSIGTAFPFGSIPGWEYGKEYYLEAQYDVAAQVIRRKVDGVSIADLAMTSTTQTAITAGTAQFAAGIIASSGTIAGNIEYSYWFKDMYLVEKTNDGTADTFLGPQQVVPITTSSIDQPTWAATGAADAVTALNTDITDVASLATPVVTSDVNNLTANIGLAIPNFPGQINAVILDVSGRKKDGSVGNIGSQVVSGGDSSPVVNTSLTNTPTGGYRLYFGEKSPAGVRWTRSAIQAAKLKLITG